LDVGNNKRIGEAVLSVYSVIQRDADNYFGTNVSNDSIKICDPNDRSRILGNFDAQVSFVEDIAGLYLSPNPRVAAAGPPETFSVDRLTIHIARFQEFIDMFAHTFREYQKLVEWEDPFITLVIVSILIYCCFTIDAEYALCGPFFLVVLFMTSSMIRRRTGGYKNAFLSIKSNKGDTEEKYQPHAILRVSVLAFRQPAVMVTSGTFNYLKVSSGTSKLQSSVLPTTKPRIKVTFVTPSCALSDAENRSIKSPKTPLGEKELFVGFLSSSIHQGMISVNTL
jgi:hypothetical protein